MELVLRKRTFECFFPRESGVRQFAQMSEFQLSRHDSSEIAVRYEHFRLS
jgi:hypothetical protein